MLAALTLVMLAGLASVYSTRSVWIDRLASHYQSHAMQARWASEAALAWARAELSRAYAQDPEAAALWQNAAATPCPSDYNGPRWQCRLLVPPQHPTMGHTASQVVVVRDLVDSPHVAELHASASQAGQHSRGQVSASVFLPVMARAPDNAVAAALVMNGCASTAAGAAITICPHSRQGQSCTGPGTGQAVHSFWLSDSDGNGLISNAERNHCLGFSAAQLPGGGDLTGPAVALPRAPCRADAWKNVLGEIRPEQIQAWSHAQERNGLHDQSQPPRQIYWVDNAATWTQSLGQPDAPVLLVFSSQACAVRCPSLASGVRIVGTVVLQSQCQDDKTQAWHAGHIEGQLVVESGLPNLQSGSHIQARAFSKPAHQLDWPAQMDITQVQRIAGSWREPQR